MPFIGRKFYMNPAYGRAVEGARLAEAGFQAREGEELVDGDAAPQQQGSDDNGHWVTIGHRHVLIRETRTGQVRYDAPRNEREARLANVVFNETGSLRADPHAKPDGPGSAGDLQNARVAIAEVADTVTKMGHPDRVAPSDLDVESWEALTHGDPNAVAAHNASLSAARQAIAGSNITNGATQFRMRQDGDMTAPIGGQSPVTMHYGPFPDARPHKGTAVIVVAR